MTKSWKFSFALFFILQTVFVHSVRTQSEEFTGLEKKIRNLLEETDSGVFAVAFTDLNNPMQHIFINEHEVFHAASTMKTPVMLEVFKQIQQGKFKLTDSLIIHNQFKSIVDGSEYVIEINEDSNEKYFDQMGSMATIYDLCFEMITKSSNLCTNILIDLTGATNVTQTMVDIGAGGIVVLRGLYDMKAYDQGLNNTTTAKGMLVLFEKLGRHELLDEPSCHQMIRILESQHYRDIIPKYLPEKIRVANKTGSISTAVHDSGLIMLPDGRKYALVLLSKNWKNQDEAKEILANISGLIYNYYMTE